MRMAAVVVAIGNRQRDQVGVRLLSTREKQYNQ